MSRSVKWILGLAALAAVAVGGLLLATPAPPRYDYRPVVRKTALADWKAPWPEERARVAAPAAARAGASTEPAAGASPAPSDGEGCAVMPRRWIVMGWDGVDWEIALPLLEAGKLPNLERLMRGGAYGDLYSYTPTQSASIWTTVATGVSPLRHGIEGFAKPPQGLWARLSERFGIKQRRTELYTNADRRVKALWNLASEQGRPVMVVGYHNTFPAEKVSGLMVSNYLVRQATMTVIPGAKAEDAASVAAHLVYPRPLIQEITKLSARIEETPYEEIRRFAEIDPQRYQRMLERFRKAPHEDLRFEYLIKGYAFDAFHGRVALALRDSYKPELLLLHFQGPDWAAHHFLYFHDPARFKGLQGHKSLERKLASELPLYRGTVAAFYAYADEWLGKLLEGDDGSTGVLVLSDHGMDENANAREPGGHNDGPPGMFVMAGPGVRRGLRVEGATVYDVMPTLAAAMGLPVAQDLEGRVLGEAFCAGALDPKRLVRVPSYETGERYQPQVELGAGFHEEIETELRGLGYIQ